MVRYYGPSFGPVSGNKPKSLVVMLHGVGADGSDLIYLAPFFAQRLPDTLFMAPDAPYPCDMGPAGRQWFSLQSFSVESVAAGTRRIAPMINSFLDETLAAYGLSDSQMALVGFSQGAMIALHVALRRPTPCAALLSYSGLLPDPDKLGAEIISRPPVFLIHGNEDEVVPPDNLDSTATTLKAAGVSVETKLCLDLAHSIDEDGLGTGASFLERHLAGAKA